MWFLLGTTLTASFFDSLNPSAIAQQMLLQAWFDQGICQPRWNNRCTFNDSVMTN